MALTIRHFDLYIIPNIAPPPVLDISQYDTSRSFVAHLKDLYGNPYSLPSGATAILEGKNKNSVVFRIETIINNDTITFIPDDVLTDTFGRIHATISIEQASQALSPLKVIFNVQRAGITKEEKTTNPDFKDAVAAAFQAYIDEHGSGGSGSGEMNVQSDWNQTNINSDAYIKNKPTRLSQFQNDSDFISLNETPYVTPEQYGAVGDGVVEIVRDPETNAVTAINVTGTDDTNAIQAALNDGNLVLCANNKTYIVTSSLQINGGTILDLNGSTFQTGNDIPIIVENQNNSAVSKVVIRNGFFGGTRFYGDGSSFTNQCGIKIRSFQSVYDNLRFDYFNYGIYMDARSTGTGTLVENRILNSKFANCMNAAIYNETGTKVTDGILNNVKIGGTGYDYGIYLKQAGGWQISNLHIYGSDISVGAEFRNCDATLLSNIYIGGNHSTAGLILHDYSHVELSNAVIQANTARTNGLWAQTSTSQRWEKKPILLSNVVFSSNAAAGSEIFAIRGGGDIQTVNVIYNDQYGAFVDSRIEPTDQDPSHVVKEAKVDEFGYDIYYPLDNGKELTNNKDFNTIIEPGNYIVTKSAVAQSAINIPEVANGRLVVSNPVGANGTNRYLRQEYRTYSTTNAIAYERYGTSSDSGETWNWRPWVSVRDSLSTAIPINSNDDLNNYTNPGAWLVRTSQIARNTANIPIVFPGRLFVMDMLNGYVRGESSIYIRQFYIPYTTAKQTYSRYAVYSNGSWTWHEWTTSESGGASESLPEPTDADNGKVLGIRNGQYTLVDDQTGDDSTFPEDTEIDLSKVAWEIGAFTASGKNYDIGGVSTVSNFATSSYTTTQSGKIRIVLASSSAIPSGYVPNVTIAKSGGGTYDLSGVVWEYGSIGTNGQNLNGVTNRIRMKDSIDVEAGSVVSCSAFSTYNEGMRVAELNMSLYRRVRTIGFIKVPARTVISCSDFSLCEKGLRVCEYAAPDLSLEAEVVSAIAPRNYRVTKSCYIRILLASDTIRYDLPLDTGSQYDGQMMTSIASEIAHAMIPAQTVRPSNAYTRRTGIPRIILPWSGYELLTTTTADAELPSTNRLSTMYGKWDALMAQYPGYIEKETVGYGEKPSGDSNDYPIYAYTLRSYIPTPDNPNRNPNSQFKFTYDKPQKNLEVIWIGTIHAHEHTVPVDDFKFFSELMKRETEVTDLLMQNCDFTVIPIMNPYGYAHFNEILNDVPNTGVRCGRVNANGVNLNRNFPEQWQYIEPFIEGEPNNDYAGAEAASESEVQAIMAFLTAHSDAFICVNRHTSSEFAPTSVLAYFASIIEEDTKIAFNACRFMDAQLHHSDLYTNYIGTVKALDFDKVQDTDSRCLYTVQKSETPGTMDKWYNAVLGLDGFLFEMSPNDHNYANSPWGREVWQRINVTGIGNMLYALMLQNEYISKG